LKVNVAIDAILVLLLLTNLLVLGSSRVLACIQTVALQAVLLGVLPLVAHIDALTWRVAVLALVSTTLKAGVLPWLLRRAVREANVQREVEPFLGFTTSLIVGVALLGVAIHLGARLPLPKADTPALLIPVALFTIMVGLLLIVSRVKAVTQVVGYLAMENGIYAFGMAFAVEEPLLVEMGVLLDVFVAVFVMGIMIYHISREFDHIDTDRLSTLKH
jgi:hydrogenase-4 component E